MQEIRTTAIEAGGSTLGDAQYVVLLGEGGHAAELQLFGYHVEPLSKTTFYFSISVLVLVDLVQTKYQNKLLKLRRRAQATPASASSQTPTPPA